MSAGPLIPFGDAEDEKISAAKMEAIARRLYASWPAIWWWLYAQAASGVTPKAPRGGRAADKQVDQLIDEIAERRQVGGTR